MSFATFTKKVLKVSHTSLVLFTILSKLVNKINIKKDTGVDKISSKLVHAGAPVLKHITTLVNNTIKTSVFPTRLKEAQVVPLHKKNDPLDKKNYRPNGLTGVKMFRFLSTSTFFLKICVNRFSFYFGNKISLFSVCFPGFICFVFPVKPFL
jgi:hypothetical protein